LDGTIDIGADEFIDNDSDSLPDWWEILHYADAAADPDDDGLTNLGEYEQDTDPDSRDTDGDGRSDGTEITDVTNPLHPDNPERTYYVNGDTGDDDYDGLAASWDGIHGPKQTIAEGIGATKKRWNYTVLVADGIYTGLKNKNLSFWGRAITLCSENGPETCIIDCDNNWRALKLDGHEGPDSVVDGFTICNGRIDEPGAGIYIRDSNPTISNCIIRDNLVTGGHRGGGIYADGSPTIINCIVVGNSAAEGGGIMCKSPTIKNCIISANEAFDRGGGLYCREGELAIDSCTIADNEARLRCGGIYGDECSVRITNSILWGNSPKQIEGYLLVAKLENCDIQGGWSGQGSNNIDSDPMFVGGANGHYYLSQAAAGQASDSPCVDAGSDTAQSLGFNRLSTRTDEARDTGAVDMGYHFYALGVNSITMVDDGTTLHWSAKPYVKYIVEISSDLENWTSIPVGETDTWTDPNAHGCKRRFYRIREQ
jgi:hypothetical protein